MNPLLIRLGRRYFEEKEELRRTLEEEINETKRKLEYAIYNEERDLLDKQCVNLEKEQERIATVIIMNEYLKIMNMSYMAKNALKMVKILCLEDSPETFKAEISLELYNLRVFRYKFRYFFQRFPQVLLHESKANRNTVDACRGFISQVKETMDHDIMHELCYALPDFLENGDQSAIKSFVADAEVLTAELSLIKNGSKLHIENKDLNELTALSTQEVFIDFLEKSLLQTKPVILLIIIAWILCFCL